jgi:shikimate dehydrogenase
MGVESVSLMVRNPSRSSETTDTLSELGLAVSVIPLETLAHQEPPDLVASTIPGPAQADLEFPVAVRENSHLFDVAYAPWPSHLASQWEQSSKQVISGLWMLAYQALAQIRLFHHHDHTRALPNEHKVFDAMTSAVGLSSTEA